MTNEEPMHFKDMVGLTGFLSIMLAGSIGLCGLTAGFDSYRGKYNFDGQIGKEKVRFEQTQKGRGYPGAPGEYSLQVEKNDGRKISYFDNDRGNKKIESMNIIQNGQTNWVYNTPEGKPTLELGQKQFENYLNKIRTINEEKIKIDRQNEEQTRKEELEAKINQNLELIK